MSMISAIQPRLNMAKFIYAVQKNMINYKVAMHDSIKNPADKINIE